MSKTQNEVSIKVNADTETATKSLGKVMVYLDNIKNCVKELRSFGLKKKTINKMINEIIISVED